MPFISFIGATFAIGIIATIADGTGVPLLMTPLGASCVLLFAAPNSPYAHPRNLVFGHLISCFVGLAVASLHVHGPWAMAISVGAAIAAMQLTKTLHPPAGADPLVILMTENASIHGFLVSVPLGVLLLLLVALVFNNVVRRQRWPASWLSGD
ncbi:HPP family protein [Burkholderia vietnamiensis]|uniref:HPP family protein n=1 Tax=Burkholderia vietnamiensis TaxID=60552 RepID=UPI002651821E|nr:HPP family protein [Burkholderia vietnamiensis]MDN7407982.1 HPP family protein [Burkholderia vietnamiensis]